MTERFTDRAREAIGKAREAAGALASSPPQEERRLAQESAEGAEEAP